MTTRVEKPAFFLKARTAYFKSLKMASSIVSPKGSKKDFRETTPSPYTTIREADRKVSPIAHKSVQSRKTLIRKGVSFILSGGSRQMSFLYRAR